MSTKPNDFTMRMAKVMVGGAVFAAAVYAIDLGFARASSWYLVPAIVVGLLSVVIGEILCWHNAGISFHERRLGSMILWGTLAVACSAGTLYTNYSTSALNQDEKSSVQLTAFTAFDDLAKTERELTKRLEQIDERARLAPVDTPEAFMSRIDNAKAHKFWKRTEGCKQTFGKETRKFCDDYASAVAGKSNAEESLTLPEERKAVEAKLAEVRSERKTTKAVVSDDTPGVTLIANMTGDKMVARQIDSMTLPLLVQAIMLFGGILLANEHARGMEKKPWINWRKLGYYVNWIACALSFKDFPEHNEIIKQTVNVDGRAAEVLRETMGKIHVPQRLAVA